MKPKILTLISVLFLFLSMPVYAKSSAALDSLVAESKARADIIETVQKAVVHIKVEKTVNNRIERQPYNNPFDLFNDRLFPGLQNPNFPREYKQEGAGSGAIIDKNGHILTNNHVVKESDKIIVHLFDGREYEAKIIGTDPLTDIAVIQIEADNLSVLPMGDSDDIRIGETVIAIGNPFGLSHTVTMGIVSAKGRSNMDIADYEDFIQTDAAINPGNSGGPLINLEGKIIGVNTAIFTKSGGYQGIGFSVPINMARKVMDQLIQSGKVTRGWLGVLLQDLTSDLAKALNINNTQGSLVAEVTKDSPAEKGGLQRGDVITRVNGKLIKNTEQLRNEIGLTVPGSKVELEVFRKGDKTRLQIVLGERLDQSYAASDQTLSENKMGMIVQSMTPELARRFGYTRVMPGVVITSVYPGSPAAKAGLRPGLVIMEINQRVVDSLDNYEDALKRVNIDDGILLLVGDQNRIQYVIIKP